MNLFFVLGSGDDAELVTPELTGTLLPGITRDSLITVARDWATPSPSGCSAWTSGARRRRRHGHRDLRLRHRRRDHPCRRGEGAHRRLHRRRGNPGPLTMQLRETLLDIQHGRVADTHGWLHRVA